MKSPTIYPYGGPMYAGCSRRLNLRDLALFCGFYIFNISIVVAALYTWRIFVLLRGNEELADVYSGVQLSYGIIIAVHLAMAALSIVLLVAVYREMHTRLGYCILGLLFFAAMETMVTVYSNVLRDHVHRRFDTFCRVESVFLFARLVLSFFVVVVIVRFVHLLGHGVTWRGPEIVEL